MTWKCPVLPRDRGLGVMRWMSAPIEKSQPHLGNSSRSTSRFNPKWNQFNTSAGSAGTRSAFVERMIFKRISKWGTRLAFVLLAVCTGSSFCAYADQEPISSPYPSGDAYLLHGHLEPEVTLSELQRFSAVAYRLAQLGFRTIVNPLATVESVREASRNPNTTLIIWSGHAMEDGELFDSIGCALPQDAFLQSEYGRLGHLVVSSCNGDAVRARYRVYPGTLFTVWLGTTVSDHLFNYLNSSEFERSVLRKIKEVQARHDRLAACTRSVK